MEEKTNCPLLQLELMVAQVITQLLHGDITDASTLIQIFIECTDYDAFGCARDADATLRLVKQKGSCKEKNGRARAPTFLPITVTGSGVVRNTMNFSPLNRSP